MVALESYYIGSLYGPGTPVTKHQRGDILICLFFLGELVLQVEGYGLRIPAILGAIPILLIARKPHFRLRWPYGILLGFIISAMASTLIISMTHDSSLRAVSGALTVVYALCAIIIGCFLSVWRNKWFRFGAVILVISSALTLAVRISESGLDWQRLMYVNAYALKNELVTAFGASNYIAAYLLFYIGYFWHTNKRWLMIISLVGILLTFSKAGIILSILFIIWSLLKQTTTYLGRNSARRYIMVTLVVAAMGLMAPTLLDTGDGFLAETRLSQTLHNTSVARLSLMTDAWSVIQERPWFGSGPGALVTARDHWSAHNGILDLWMSFGALSMILFYALYGYVLVKLMKIAKYSVNVEDRREAYGFLSGLLLMLIHGMVEPLHVGSQFVMFICLIMSSVVRSPSR